MIQRLFKLFALLLIIGGIDAQLALPAQAENAVQRAADRTSHDRWARSEPSGGHHSSDDGDDDDDNSQHSSHHHEAPSAHDGELNGHLSLKGW